MTVRGVIGSPLTLNCTSVHSPLDTLTWLKDGVPITQSINITKVSHSLDTAKFNASHTISSFNSSHIGIYTCTVVNPLGSDSHNIEVVIESELIAAMNHSNFYNKTLMLNVLY